MQHFRGTTDIFQPVVGKLAGHLPCPAGSASFRRPQRRGVHVCRCHELEYSLVVGVDLFARAIESTKLAQPLLATCVAKGTPINWVIALSTPSTVADHARFNGCSSQTVQHAAMTMCHASCLTYHSALRFAPSLPLLRYFLFYGVAHLLISLSSRGLSTTLSRPPAFLSLQPPGQREGI